MFAAIFLLAFVVAALAVAAVATRAAAADVEAELDRRARVQAPAPPERPSFVPDDAGLVRAALDARGAAEGDMAQLGARIRDAGVCAVVFVHGTFAGNDPFALARLLRRVAPRTARRLETSLLRTTKRAFDRVLGDAGNFTPAYVAACERDLAAGIPCSLFVWSSTNHHAARVRAAGELARALAAIARGAARGDRILLVGHSHGGQVFAVLTQLLARSAGSDDVHAAAGGAALEADLAEVRRVHLDVVTLGTPPRYGWSAWDRYRLLHLVDARDVVHRLGAAGSDFPSPCADDRALDARLGAALGPGTAVRPWLRALVARRITSRHGQTCVIDYGVGGPWRTGLNHLHYTRGATRLANVRLIADRFYPEPRGGTRAP